MLALMGIVKLNSKQKSATLTKKTLSQLVYCNILPMCSINSVRSVFIMKTCTSNTRMMRLCPQKVWKVGHLTVTVLLKLQE